MQVATSLGGAHRSDTPTADYTTTHICLADQSTTYPHIESKQCSNFFRTNSNESTRSTKHHQRILTTTNPPTSPPNFSPKYTDGQEARHTIRIKQEQLLTKAGLLPKGHIPVAQTQPEELRLAAPPTKQAKKASEAVGSGGNLEQ